MSEVNPATYHPSNLTCTLNVPPQASPAWQGEEQPQQHLSTHAQLWPGLKPNSGCQVVAHGCGMISPGLSSPRKLSLGPGYSTNRLPDSPAVGSGARLSDCMQTP